MGYARPPPGFQCTAGTARSRRARGHIPLQAEARLVTFAVVRETHGDPGVVHRVTQAKVLRGGLQMVSSWLTTFHIWERR